ncbi:MAG: hypothetical protein ACPGVO_03790 [Spirulinaceae cyanobacterium]
MRLSIMLAGFISGVAIAAVPQLAQAQNSIPITGGSIEVRGLNDATQTTATFITPQGTVSSNTATIVSTNGWLNPCCSIVGHLSGVGFSPSGPVVFSNLPFAVETIGGHAYLPISGGARRDIRGGMINGAYTDHAVPRARTMHTPGQSIMHNLSIQTGIDLSPGQFSFEQTAFTTPTSSPATNSPQQPTPPTVTTRQFSLPESLTEPGNPNPQNQAPTNSARPLRPNGVHTRIMPVWTPGLYQ